MLDLRILAVGDVCGEAGLKYACANLRRLRQKLAVDFCVVNGENASVVGLMPQQAERLLSAGADVITLGNHSFNRRQLVPMLESDPRVLRPHNLSPLAPGRGWGVYDCRRTKLAVVNLIGRCNMDFTPDNPFLQIERLLESLKTRLVLVDFHAEATSEKRAMGFFLDGKIAALWGTHTHVPTADAEVLPGGTGYVTDLGMTGPVQSVIGIRPEQSVALFRGELTSRFETAPGPCKLESVLFTLDSATGRCRSAVRVDLKEEGS